MKLAVIGGAGLLGSTAAFCAGGMDVLEEIRLLDIRENMTMSHVMDMDQALSSCSRTKVTKGDYKRLEDCELILITASVPETGTGTRDSYLQANRDIVTEICSKLRGLNQNHVIINAVNPVAVINVVIQDCTGLGRRQIIGFSANDTLRLKWAVAKVLNIGADRVDAICLGEHGEKNSPAFQPYFYRSKTCAAGCTAEGGCAFGNALLVFPLSGAAKRANQRVDFRRTTGAYHSSNCVRQRTGAAVFRHTGW